MAVPSVEVVFDPSLLTSIEKKPGRNVVVVDILRATTAMCTAFGFGVKSIIPVKSKAEAQRMKKQGWLVAGEENGEKLPFADFTNSPGEFRTKELEGKEIVYSTTNGTKAILAASEYGNVLVASFVNLNTVCNWLKRDGKDVLILCAGWEKSFSLEDAVFAGAMADLLVNAYGYMPVSDSAIAAMILWAQSSKDFMKTVSKGNHYIRLLGIENRKMLEYCFYPEVFQVVPVLEGDKLVDRK